MAPLPKIPSGRTSQALFNTKPGVLKAVQYPYLPPQIPWQCMSTNSVKTNKSATIRRRINSLGTVLKLSKNYDPTKQPEVILELKRMHQKIGRAQEQASPLAKPLLNQLLSNCDTNVIGVRNQVLLRLGYETMRRRSELCTFKFDDIDQAPNGKPILKLNFSENDQFGTGKILTISKDLFDLLRK